jgi:hypothetical protein
MQTRKRTKGHYASHNTPGDGTGFSKCKELDYACDILTDANLAKPDGTDTTPGQWYPAQED